MLRMDGREELLTAIEAIQDSTAQETAEVLLLSTDESAPSSPKSIRALGGTRWAMKVLDTEFVADSRSEMTLADHELSRVEEEENDARDEATPVAEVTCRVLLDLTASLKPELTSGESMASKMASLVASFWREE